MFQAVRPSIIRSSKLYTQRQVFVRLMLLPAAIVPETCRASCELNKIEKSCISLVVFCEKNLERDLLRVKLVQLLSSHSPGEVIEIGIIGSFELHNSQHDLVFA